MSNVIATWPATSYPSSISKSMTVLDTSETDLLIKKNSLSIQSTNMLPPKSSPSINKRKILSRGSEVVYNRANRNLVYVNRADLFVNGELRSGYRATTLPRLTYRLPIPGTRDVITISLRVFIARNFFNAHHSIYIQKMGSGFRREWKPNRRSKMKEKGKIEGSYGFGGEDGYGDGSDETEADRAVFEKEDMKSWVHMKPRAGKGDESWQLQYAWGDRLVVIEEVESVVAEESVE